jgi:hypothetical protein
MNTEDAQPISSLYHPHTLQVHPPSTQGHVIEGFVSAKVGPPSSEPPKSTRIHHRVRNPRTCRRLRIFNSIARVEPMAFRMAMITAEHSSTIKGWSSNLAISSSTSTGVGFFTPFLTFFGMLILKLRTCSSSRPRATIEGKGSHQEG